MFQKGLWVTLNKEKVTAIAMKHLQKGALEKAVKEFEKILEADPEDERTLQKVGDLYTRMNQRQEALNAYRRVSELYVQHGFYQKAIAVYRQILQLDPSQIELNIKLAEMHHQLGLLSDAVQFYSLVIKFYEEQERHKDALAILRKITEIDPDNLPNRIRLAEGLFKLGAPEEGIAEYEQTLRALELAGKKDEYLRVLDRLFHHAPQKKERGHELATLLIKAGETKKALARLQVLLKQDPEDLKTLELLAQVFLSLRQLSKTITVYLEMSRILSDRRDFIKLRDTYAKILEIDPENEEALEGTKRLPFSTSFPGAPDQSQTHESRLEELSVLSDESEDLAPPPMESLPKLQSSMARATAAPHVVAASPKATAAPGATKLPAEAEAKPADFTKMLTEAEVFAKYGLHDQAQARLAMILAADPDNLQALEKLRDICLRIEEHVKARQALIHIGVIHLEHGRTEEGHNALDQAIQIGGPPGRLEAYIKALGVEAPEKVAAKLRDEYRIPARKAGTIVPSSSATAPKAATVVPAPKPAPAAASPMKTMIVGEQEIDFDQDVEMLDPEIERPEALEDEGLPEVDIIEETMLPPPSAVAGTSGTTRLPTPPKAPVRPPNLPAGDAIEVEEEFDDQLVDELLFAQEIKKSETEDVPHRKPPEPVRLSESAGDRDEENGEALVAIEDLEDFEEETGENLLDIEDIDVIEEEPPAPVVLEEKDDSEYLAMLESGQWEELPPIDEDGVAAVGDGKEAESEFVAEPAVRAVSAKTDQAWSDDDLHYMMGLDAPEIAVPAPEHETHEQVYGTQAAEDIADLFVEEALKEQRQAASVKAAAAEPFEAPEDLPEESLTEDASVPVSLALSVSVEEAPSSAEALAEEESPAEETLFTPDIADQTQASEEIREEQEAAPELVLDEAPLVLPPETPTEDMTAVETSDAPENQEEVEEEADVSRAAETLDLPEAPEPEAEPETTRSSEEDELAELLGGVPEEAPQEPLLEESLEFQQLEEELVLEAPAPEDDILQQAVEVLEKGDLAPPRASEEKPAKPVTPKQDREPPSPPVPQTFETKAVEKKETVQAPPEELDFSLLSAEEEASLEAALPPVSLDDLPELISSAGKVEPFEARLDEAGAEEYEEAAFFFEQGVYNECLPIYQKLLERFGSHPELVEKIRTCKAELEAQGRSRHSSVVDLIPDSSIAELKSEPAPQAAPEPEPEMLSDDEIELDVLPDIEPVAPVGLAPTADGSVNLADELMELSEGETAESEAVRTPAVRLVEDIGADETETHFNLGIAYREMGLTDEAIGEFLVASKGKRAMETAQLLGLCYFDKGRDDLAAQYLQKVLAQTRLSISHFMALRYDLGIISLVKNRKPRALAHFESMAAFKPDYRDIAPRIQALKAEGVTADHSDPVCALFDNVDQLSLTEG